VGWREIERIREKIERTLERGKLSDLPQFIFQDIQESCEPTMFSIEQLLFAIANDQRTKDETVVKILPMLAEVYEAEKVNRQALKVSSL
jgi:hypothetical protein